MSVDPDSIAKRSRSVSRSENKMDDKQSLGRRANTDDAIEAMLNE